MRVNQAANNSSQTSEAANVKHGGKASAAHETKSEKSTSGALERAVNGDANTEISSKSKEFATAKAVASSSPDIREDKVADLKRRITEGSYKVDADSIADHLVDEHLRMPTLR